MVDKTMMGDKCAELVRAAMIGALAVTLGNPTAVYAAEEETADPGQIGIEIAGEACWIRRQSGRARWVSCWATSKYRASVSSL